MTNPDRRPVFTPNEDMWNGLGFSRGEIVRHRPTGRLAVVREVGVESALVLLDTISPDTLSDEPIFTARGGVSSIQIEMAGGGGGGGALPAGGSGGGIVWLAPTGSPKPKITASGGSGGSDNGGNGGGGGATTKMTISNEVASVRWLDTQQTEFVPLSSILVASAIDLLATLEDDPPGVGES